VMRADASWVQLLTLHGIAPSATVVEQAIFEHAPVVSLMPLLAAVGVQAGSERTTSEGTAAALESLSIQTWQRIAERGDEDAGAATSAVMFVTHQPPPQSIISKAFEHSREPMVIEVLARAFSDKSPAIQIGAKSIKALVTLPDNVWLQLVDRSMQSSRSSSPEHAVCASPSQAEALLNVALRFCRRPAGSLATKIWEHAVKQRSPSTVRTLRGHGVAPSRSPRADGAQDEECTNLEATRVYADKLKDGTPVVAKVLMNRERALLAAQLDKVSKTDGSEAAITASLIDCETEVVTGVPQTDKQRSGKSEAADALLLEVTKPPGFDASGATRQNQEELLHEVVQCQEVRTHLDWTSQMDRDAIIELDPAALTPRSRRRSAQVIAARMLGRAALREQGQPARSARLPPPKPLPDLKVLEAQDEKVVLFKRKDDHVGGDV